jgi:hypothetical protein
MLSHKAKIIYANLGGPSRALKRDGSVDTENDLLDFVRGFNGDRFSGFVDVGNFHGNSFPAHR